MSLCDQFEAGRDARSLHRHEAAAALTPEECEQEQDRIMARWLALWPSEKNRRLARVGATARVPQQIDKCLTVGDVTATYREWATVTGLHEDTIRDRVERGLSPEAVIVPREHVRSAVTSPPP